MPKWRHRGVHFRFDVKTKLITKFVIDELDGNIKRSPIPLSSKKSLRRLVLLLMRLEKHKIHWLKIARSVNRIPDEDPEMWELDEGFFNDNLVNIVKEELDYLLRRGVKTVDKSAKFRYKRLVKTE